MGDYADDFTLDELFIATLARQIRDGDRIHYGVESLLPFIAWLLARQTHAPDCTLLTLLGSIDPDPSKLTYSTGDPHILDSALCTISMCRGTGMVRAKGFDLMMFGGAQIDKYGSVNQSFIGNHARPRVKLPGGAGGAEMVHLFQRYVLYRTVHTRRIFVEKVDFVTYPGWIKEVAWRRGGPEKVITNLAVMGFDAQTKQMKLESVHRGVKVSDVAENTGFDLIIPAGVDETEPPTREQIELIREKIDPDGIRKTQFPEAE